MIEKKDTVNQLLGFYRGIVKAHLNNGRCKVWIPGVYSKNFEDFPEKLPDAQQATPLFAVSSNERGNGLYFYPEIGSIVWCFFENNDANFPVYFAATREFDEAEGVYDSLNKGNVKILKIDNVEVLFNRDDEKVSISVYSNESSEAAEEDLSGKTPEQIRKEAENESNGGSRQALATIKINGDGGIEIFGNSISMKATNDIVLDGNVVNVQSEEKTLVVSKAEAMVYSSRVGIKSHGGGINIGGDIDERVFS